MSLNNRKEISEAVKSELMLVVCGVGFLGVYASENKKPSNHPIYTLIRMLQTDLYMYKKRFNGLWEESFKIFDDIIKDEMVEIDTIAFSNALLTYHSQNKKLLSSRIKQVSKFWIDYKKECKTGDREQDKAINARYRNSRELATKFMEKIYE